MPIIKVAVRGDRSPEELRENRGGTKSRIKLRAGRRRLAQANVYGGAATRSSASIFPRTAWKRISSHHGTRGHARVGKSGTRRRNASPRDPRIQHPHHGRYPDVQSIADTIVSTNNGSDTSASPISGRSRWATRTKPHPCSSTVNLESISPSSSRAARTGQTWMTTSTPKIEEVSKVLPTGITLEIVVDNTDQIRATITEIVSSLLQGAVLTMVVLFLFLRAWNMTLIVGHLHPFSMVITSSL
jgi:hypothetical protein